MNDLYQLCMQEINLTLDDFKKHHQSKNLKCDITVEEKLSNDVAFVVSVKIKVKLDDAKMKKAWDKIRTEIRMKIGRGLSILEFIDVYINKDEDEYSYMIFMFR